MKTKKYCKKNSPNYITLLIWIFLGGYGINWVRFDLFPGMISCGGGKAYHAEAKNNIGALNRAQQAYFLEYQKFSEDLQKLDVGIKSQTKNYSYSIRATKKAVFNYAVARPDVHKLRTKYFGPFWWDSKEPLKLKSYVGGRFCCTCY